jgi:hypothetical protein
VAGVIVYDWFDPCVTIVVPRGAMAPFAPADEVIAYWLIAKTALIV